VAQGECSHVAHELFLDFIQDPGEEACFLDQVCNTCADAEFCNILESLAGADDLLSTLAVSVGGGVSFLTLNASSREKRRSLDATISRKGDGGESRRRRKDVPVEEAQAVVEEEQNRCGFSTYRGLFGVLPSEKQVEAGLSKHGKPMMDIQQGAECQEMPTSTEADLQALTAIWTAALTPSDTKCQDHEQTRSVGSLAHDTCCRMCQGGYMCGESGNLPTLESTDGIDIESKPCGMEWRKAVANAHHGRYWCEKKMSEFSETLASLHETLEGERKIVKRYDVATVSGQKPCWSYMKSEGVAVPRRDFVLLVGTQYVCADEGIELDCIDCETCANSGDGKRCDAGVGDSDFCCNGEFSEVVEQSGWTYGVCG
jgi:hypothetical protein